MLAGGGGGCFSAVRNIISRFCSLYFACSVIVKCKRIGSSSFFSSSSALVKGLFLLCVVVVLPSNNNNCLFFFAFLGLLSQAKVVAALELVDASRALWAAVAGGAGEPGEGRSLAEAKLVALCLALVPPVGVRLCRRLFGRFSCLNVILLSHLLSFSSLSSQCPGSLAQAKGEALRLGALDAQRLGHVQGRLQAVVVDVAAGAALVVVAAGGGGAIVAGAAGSSVLLPQQKVNQLVLGEEKVAGVDAVASSAASSLAQAKVVRSRGGSLYGC